MEEFFWFLEYIFLYSFSLFSKGPNTLKMELDIKKLEEHQLSPDEFVFLYFLVHPQVHPQLPGVIDHKRLELKGMIKIGPDDNYYARKAAINLVAPKVEKTEKTVEDSTPQQSSVRDDVNEWIANWRSLFPMGVKTGGYSVRGTRGGCVKKMRSFLRKNPAVTKDQVFEATKRYIAEKQRVNFAYMKIADYFIEKEGGSLLEEYVEGLKTSKGQDSLFHPNIQLNPGDLTDDI